MNRKALVSMIAAVLTTMTGVAMACEYKAGETLFLDYAHCRYGEDNILVIDLPEGSSWQKCYYYLQAFTPEKLLAISKQENGKERLSVSDRSQIGNPCYLTKKYCDAALRKFKQN